VREFARSVGAEAALQKQLDFLAGFGGDAAVPEIADPPPVVPLGIGQSLEDERERFRALLNGRRPTGQEVAEFEARFMVIQRGRGNKSDELLRRETQQRSATPDHPDVGFIRQPRRGSRGRSSRSSTHGAPLSTRHSRTRRAHEFRRRCRARQAVSGPHDEQALPEHMLPDLAPPGHGRSLRFLALPDQWVMLPVRYD
jgi:hypothetical protein